MLDLKLTIKNFRCFSDADPVQIDIRSGVTAIVGPNNAGKSSLLRMFFELRDLFRRSSRDTSFVQAVLAGNRSQFNPAGVPDPKALFHDNNARAITLRVDTPTPPDEDLVSGLEFSLEREAPNYSKARAYKGPSRAIVSEGGYSAKANGTFILNGSTVRFSHYSECVDPLTNTLYIGPFRNILNQSKAQYFDLTVGTDFVSMWDSWKNGHDKEQNRAIKSAENAIARLFHFESLEINASPNKEELRVFVNGQPYSLHEQGAGLSQFVLAFGFAATRRPSLILIDEPELNLHPSLQIDFLTTLATFASEGILFSTHSIGLARSTADTIYSIQKRGGHSILRKYEETPSLQEFAGELSFSTFRDLGLERMLLVEGPTDVRTAQQLLRKLDKDHRVVVFPLLGHAFASGDHDAALIELRRVIDPTKVSALVDSERELAGGPPHPKRKAFADACKREGFYSVLLTERRAIENYFTQNAIHVGVGLQYEALAPFEKLGTAPKNWSKTLNWKIAHATSLEQLDGTDLLLFLRDL